MSILKYKERKNTDCAKWDGVKDTFGKEDLLPFWVADMDFEVPECVREAMHRYIDQGTFGYYKVPDSFFQSFIDWEEKFHHYKVEKEWIRFAPGVVPAFNWLVNILTEEKDAVIINQPVYYPFHDAIVNNHRKLVDSPLISLDGHYTFDFQDFEQKIIDHDVKAFILCSPHNPVGRVWTEEELKKVLDICKKHQVYVISDEIHQDIVLSGFEQIPSATVGEYDEILITLTAASKTFNLAACQNSFVIIPDKSLRDRYDAFTKRIRIASGNALGYIAVQSAYEGGRGWLDEVLTVIHKNYTYIKSTLATQLPDAIVTELQGTYLLWVDLSAYAHGKDLEKILLNDCKIGVDFGSWFGGKPYDGFIRINLATRPENVKIAISRLVKHLTFTE